MAFSAVSTCGSMTRYRVQGWIFGVEGFALAASMPHCDDSAIPVYC